MGKKVARVVKRVLWWFSLTICVLLMVCGCLGFLWYYKDSMESKDLYDSLADIHDSVLYDVTYPSEEPTASTELPSKEEVIVPPSIVEKGYLLECQELYQMNNDLVGWISVPDTLINYPVLQTGKNTRDYYLRRDFYKKYNRHGCIYASEDCNVFSPSDNVTLYGHCMKDGTMFAPLNGYKEYEYWYNNQYFTFDTLYEHHKYRIFAVFKTPASGGFKYHMFVNANTEEEFNAFISTIKELQFYNTGVEVEYGDKIVCLSTCEYTLGDGRYVVVGKRIS